MAWKAMDVQDQRVRFVLAASQRGSHWVRCVLSSVSLVRPERCGSDATLKTVWLVCGTQPSASQFSLADGVGAGRAGDCAAAAVIRTGARASSKFCCGRRASS